jgi:hypothetical protein
MTNGPEGTELFQEEEWTDGRTDRHHEVNSHFWKFWEGV